MHLGMFCLFPGPFVSGGRRNKTKTDNHGHNQAERPHAAHLISLRRLHFLFFERDMGKTPTKSIPGKRSMRSLAGAIFNVLFQG
jgi:hypothetical protein